MYKGDRSRKETLVEYGFRLPSALDNRPLRFEEWEALAPQMIFVSATPGKYEAQQSGAGGGAGGAAHGPGRSGGRDPPRAHAGGRRALRDQPAAWQRGERVLITTLTKRMAEDLTEYLDEHGVKVRYLHSDIETVERMEIIRDLRLGKFDVLVGINLLREGLDMPEVSLVAILDADKEGFLRSEGSLIQTIGRAARNLNGTGHPVRGPRHRLDAARDGRNRPAPREAAGIQRRARHHAARRHQGASRTSWKARARSGARRGRQGGAGPASGRDSDRPLTPEQVAREIKRLEERDVKHARNLEFEEAARLRDADPDAAAEVELELA